MSSPSRPVGKLTAKEITALALLGAMIFASKMALASLPNINMNALFIILGGVFFGWKVLYSVIIYIMLEGLCFGFGLWWFCYWYLWPILVVLVMVFRKNDSALLWAVIAAVFGLCFGALCSVPYLFIGGWEMALSMWVSGIPFDFLHCAGNFVTVISLYRPLSSLMENLLRRSRIEAVGTDAEKCPEDDYGRQL